MSAVKILFDTDIGADCDDAGALALLHRLCDRGEAELLAVTACYASPHAAGCIDAINTYYGRPVPVGINHGVPPFERSVYAEQLCGEFPHRFSADSDVPDTIDLLRRTLAEAEDGSITLVVTGMLTSAAGLVMSAPDAISPLSGCDLIERKTARTVVMGGRFHGTWPMQIGRDRDMRAEWNIRCDIPSAQTVCANWPGVLIFSSFEIGLWCVSLCDFVKRGRPDDPVRRAYELHPSGRNGRESWDLTAMLEAVRPGQYWNLHEYGCVIVDADGVTTWQPKAGGRHTYLLPRADYDEVREVIDRLVIE